MNAHVDEETGEVMEQTVTLPTTQVSSSMAVALSRAELDQQIATAKAFPRSYQRFLDDSKQLVCLNAQIADSCNYALPRRKNGKRIFINGPSVRFAEIIQGRYGNCVAASRVVGEDGDYVVAEGVFQDLESLSVTRTQTRRRIVDSQGRRYTVDMVGVTGNAACQIAKRNAILQGIGKALWEPLYQSALRTAAGSEKSIEDRRAEMIAHFKAMDVTDEEIFAAVGVEGLADIGVEELQTLRALAKQIKAKDLTVDEAFRPEPEAPSGETARKVAAELNGQPKDPEPKGARKSRAKKAAPQGDEQPAELELGSTPVSPDESVKLAISVLQACKTTAQLKEARQRVWSQFKAAGQQVPLPVEACFQEMLEALTEREAIQGDEGSGDE